MQKQQYLQGFRQNICKNNNIYKVSCNTHAKTTIFTRFHATRMQKQQYVQGSYAAYMQKQKYLYGRKQQYL